MIVRATEVLGEDDTGPAQYTEVTITVNIEDVDDPGRVTFDYLQPQAGVEWKATFKDQDSGAVGGESYEWSVPKVSRPAINNDQHWADAGGPGRTADTYRPVMSREAADDDDDTTADIDETVAVTGEEGKILRVKVTYSDVHGGDKVVYAKTDVPVRAEPETNNAPAFTDANPLRSVNENAKAGTHVGNPVTATVDEDPSLLTYRLSNAAGEVVDGSDVPLTVLVFTDVAGGTAASANWFKIDSKTGQIAVAMAGLDRDAGEADGALESYWVFVQARDPSGIRNDGDEVDAVTRAEPFPVNITVKEVNEKPVVAVLMDDPNVTTDDEAPPMAPETFSYDVMIGENHPLKDMLGDHDDMDETGDQIVTPANVIFEVSDVAGVPGVMVFTFVATDVDGDDAGTTDTIEDNDNVTKKVKLTLAGDDMADFTLYEIKTDVNQDGDVDDPGDLGQGRYELRFKDSKPDFESPMDANKDNRYEVSVVATDDEGLASMKDLTVKVINQREDGKVKLSTDQPAVGIPLTATLEDPDTDEINLKWQWQSSGTSDDTFEDITGATSDTYTPKAATLDDDTATTTHR